MEQTYDRSFFHAEERDRSGKKRAKIFLAVLVVFAGLVALAVALQKSQPQVSRVTTETSTGQATPPPVDVPANPEAPAVPQLVPSTPAAPTAAPTAEKSASDVAPAPPARHTVARKKTAAHGRIVTTETPVPSSPAPSVAPPQLAPVPITAPAAPTPIPVPTAAPAGSTSTTAPAPSSTAPSSTTEEPPPPPPV